TIADSAARLCGTDTALINLVDGDVQRVVAGSNHRGQRFTTARPGLGSGIHDRHFGVGGRAIVDRAVVHIDDLAAVPQSEFSAPNARTAGVRTWLAVPLLRGQEAIGAISMARIEVRPFTERQIALVRTFADQAVIAIEDA